MALIAYVGPYDFRELSKADLGTYFDEYDGKKLKFAKAVPQEIDDDVADTLLDHEHFEGEFAEVDEQDSEADTEAEAEKVAAKAAKKASKKAATTPGPGAATGDTPGPTGKSSTGAGSSTSTST
jgi:erythromycin esterase-like protein